MYDFILSFTKPDTLAAYLVAAAVFGTLMTILLPYLQGNKLETRLKAVATQRERLRKQSRAALEKKGLRRKDDSVVGNISSKLNLAKALEDPNVVKLMNQAGLRGPGRSRPSTSRGWRCRSSARLLALRLHLLRQRSRPQYVHEIRLARLRRGRRLLRAQPLHLQHRPEAPEIPDARLSRIRSTCC
jgi:hypothetical protein